MTLLNKSEAMNWCMKSFSSSRNFIGSGLQGTNYRDHMKYNQYLYSVVKSYNFCQSLYQRSIAQFEPFTVIYIDITVTVIRGTTMKILS